MDAKGKKKKDYCIFKGNLLLPNPA